MGKVDFLSNLAQARASRRGLKELFPQVPHVHRRTTSLVPLAPIPIPHQCPRNKALKVTLTALLAPLSSYLEHHDLLDTHRLPLGKTTHSSLALTLPVECRV